MWTLREVCEAKSVKTDSPFNNGPNCLGYSLCVCVCVSSIWTIFSSEPSESVEGATIGSLVSNSAVALGPDHVKGPVPGEPYQDPDRQSVSATLKRIHNMTAIKTRRGLKQTCARGCFAELHENVV